MSPRRKFKFEDGILLFSGFVLNGIVPFSIFLISGILYGTGSSEEVLVLILTVSAGSYLFTLAGLLSAKLTTRLFFPLFAISVGLTLYVFIALSIDNVLSLRQFGLISFLGMSSNLTISYLISRVSDSVRGVAFSPGHFVSMGSGSPAIFAFLYFIYIFIDYSSLPLILLVSESVGFVLAGLLIRFAAKRYRFSTEGKAS